MASFPIYGTPRPSATDGRHWKCPIGSCAKGFRQLNGVISHYHSFHDPTMQVPIESQEERPFKCPFNECHVRPYQNSNGLAYHLTKVHSEGVEFPQNASHVKRPFLNPEISRPFSCPNECGKSYRNTNGLSYHLKKFRCAKVRMQDSTLQEFLKRNSAYTSESQKSQTATRS